MGLIVMRCIVMRLAFMRHIPMRLAARREKSTERAGLRRPGSRRLARIAVCGASLALAGPVVAHVMASAMASAMANVISQIIIHAAAPVAAHAQEITAAPRKAAAPAQRAKQETLIVAASRPGSSYLAMAHDVASAITADASVRLLPIAADGGLANLRDVLQLRGVDLAIVPGNALAHAKATNALGGAVPQRVGYLTVLYGEEVHIVAGRDVATIDDLRGRKIALLAEDGTAELTAADILARLGVNAERRPMDLERALDQVRSGAVAAALLVGGKPLAHVATLPKDGSVRLLSLPSAALSGDGYLPAVLLPEDYPALIPPGAIVETVAVSAVLLTTRGREDTARRVAKHTPAVLDAVARLAVSQPHPKWRDVNLGAALPGWSRLAAAETWLKRAIERRKELLDGGAGGKVPARAKRRAKPPARPPAISAAVASGAGNKKLLDEYELWARQSVVSELAAE